MDVKLLWRSPVMGKAGQAVIPVPTLPFRVSADCRRGRQTSRFYTTCLRAGRELEGNQVRAPIIGAIGFQVLVGIPEGAIVNRINTH